MITIREITTQQTFALRFEVLRKNIDLPLEFNGDHEKETIHLGVLNENELIGISSFMKADFEGFEGLQYQLRGMATSPLHRCSGAGKLMLLKGIEMLKKRNVDVLWCNARIVAVDFYKKHGLKTFGEKFVLPQIGEHYVMYLNLN